jgi:hypothetical protein
MSRNGAATEVRVMVKAIVTFLLLAAFVFVGWNWWAAPTFPTVSQHVGALTLQGSCGVSAVAMILSLLFGKGR